MSRPIFFLRWDLWQPGLGVVDITNPEARKWYEAKLDALVDLGVDAFKDRSASLPHGGIRAINAEC